MEKRYPRRRGRNQDEAAIAWLFVGALGFLWLSARASQSETLPQPQYVGPARDVVDRLSTAQEQSMWCWAAGIQMILHSYGIIVSQEQIVARIYGSVVNEPGTDEAISASLNGWAFDGLGRKIVIHSRVGTGPPSPDLLMREVTRWHPILVSVSPDWSNMGHALVITGASHIGRRVASLVYRDPWQSPENCASYGRVELTGPEIAPFLSSVRKHWLISASFR